MVHNEPELFSKKEVFNGVELETLYRKARVPVDPEEGLDLSKAGGLQPQPMVSVQNLTSEPIQLKRDLSVSRMCL